MNESGTYFYSAVGFWERWEQLTAPVTSALIQRAQLRPGNNVVDIGCGWGLATFAASQIVGSSGAVVAFDLSSDAIAAVAALATEGGVTNVTTAVGDMERDDIPGAPFDVALNQFGLTYAVDLHATFLRIRAQLRSGGRCVFTAWVDPSRLPLLPLPLTSKYQATPSDQDPFSMADANATCQILSEAGFGDVSSEVVEISNVVPLEVIYDDAMLTQLGLEGPNLVQAREEILKFVAGFAVDGGYEAPLVFHIYSGVNPS